MDEAAFRDLIAKRKTGAVSTLLRGGLKTLSYGYGTAVALRNRLYASGWKSAHRASVPVVSVGNITVGGTGKTPFVAHLVQWFRQHDVPVALLSRGYRALPGEANDEKLLLDELCAGVPHLQNPDRVVSARAAIDEHGARLLILDDGFQHRRLARDLDIVLIDALNPWGYGHLLPRGLLRETPSAIRRADVVVVTRADLCTNSNREAIVGRLEKLRGTDERVEIVYPPGDLVNRAGESASLQHLANTRVAAFCGIGNPEGFAETLYSAGLDLEPFVKYPDHHHYGPGDLDSIAERASAAGATAIVTTQKDLVKIEPTELAGIPLWAVRIGCEILHGEELLELRLAEILGRVSR